MANIQFADYASTQLAGTITAVQTSIPVLNASVLPAAGGALYFYATFADFATQGLVNREVVKVTNKVGNVLTVVRGITGTPAIFAAGDLVDNRVCTQALIDIANASAGAPVGLSYFTIANESGTLTGSRRVASTARIAFTDGGAGSTLTYDIVANSVANSFLAQMAANTIKGNNTGGLANAADLTVAQVNTLLGTITTAGGVVSFSAGTLASRPAFGTVGRFYATTDTLGIFYDTGAAWTLVEPALTGDVTTAAGGVATTIAASAVTNAKMANMNAMTLKGNATGGAAAPTDLTGSQAITILPVFVASGLSAAAGIVPTPPGTAGTFLYLREDATWAGAFVASGASHAGGLVPDPGGSAGSSRFLREDATWAVPPGGGGGSTFYPNLFRNSGMVVNQRATQTLTTSALIGSVDSWAVWASAGAVTSGTITQGVNAVTLGQTGYALALSPYTVTGAAVISCRQRIESRDAVRLKNQTASCQFNVYQDTGGNVNYTIFVRKATVQDNFAATTNISNSGAISIGSGAQATVTYNNITMGDCSNGIEIEIQAAVGAQTAKNLYWTEAELHLGSTAQTYQYVPFEIELDWVRRFYRKSFPYGTAPATAAGTAGIVSACQPQAGAGLAGIGSIVFSTPMRATPSITLYNPSSANAQARNISTPADCTGTATSTIGDGAFYVTTNTVAGAARGDQIGIHYTADAEF